MRRPATLESVWKVALKSRRAGVPSWSLTPPAWTVTVHAASWGSDAVGSSVKTVPSPLTVNGAAAPSQASANALSAAVTGSEKVTRTFVVLVHLGGAVGGVGRRHRRPGRLVVAAGLRLRGRAQREVGGVVVGVPVALVGLVRVRRRRRERRPLLVGRAGRLADLVDDLEAPGEDGDAAVVGDPRAVGLIAGDAARAVGQQVRAARAERHARGDRRPRRDGPARVRAVDPVAADVDRRGRAVAQLDELVVAAGRAAGAVLRDDDRGRLGGGGRRGEEGREDGEQRDAKDMPRKVGRDHDGRVIPAVTTGAAARFLRCAGVRATGTLRDPARGAAGRGSCSTRSWRAARSAGRCSASSASRSSGSWCSPSAARAG